MTEQTVALIAAIFSSVVGVGAFFHYFLLVGTWPRSDGRVVGNVSELSSSGGPSAYHFFPRIQFQTPDGQLHEVKGDIGRVKEWPLGQKVGVRYRPSNPAHASIAKGWQRLLFASVFVGFSIALWMVVLGAL